MEISSWIINLLSTILNFVKFWRERKKDSVKIWISFLDRQIVVDITNSGENSIFITDVTVQIVLFLGDGRSLEKTPLEEISPDEPISYPIELKPKQPIRIKGFGKSINNTLNKGRFSYKNYKDISFRVYVIDSLRNQYVAEKLSPWKLPQLH